MSWPSFFAALGFALGIAQPSSGQDFEQLSKDLSSGDRELRREAAFQLRELGAGALPALPALIGALRDDDEQVVARAVTAIARIGPQAGDAIPALIDIMDSGRRRYNRQVTFRSAFALSEIGKPAIDPLRKTLGDSSEGRRSGAAQALHLIGAAAAPAIPELIVALRDDESAVRRPAAEALAAIGEGALAPLLRDLKESPNAAAVMAIGLMGKIAMPASDQLLELLAKSSDDASLKAAIITALGAIELPFDRLQAPLRSALTDGSEPVRLAAASVLLIYPDPEKHSLPALRAWLDDDDKGLSMRAAWVIGQFGADAASLASDLMQALERGDDPEILTAALAGLGPAATTAILNALAKVPLEELKRETHWARQILKESGALAMPALEAGLESEHASSRFIALDALAALGKTANALEPAFRKASNDPEAAVRLAALRALEGTGADSQRMATILRRRCVDDSAEVRAVAVRLLGQTADADSRAFELIDRALSDADPAVQRAGIGALGSFGTEAAKSVPRLLQLAEAADSATTLAILNTVTTIGSSAGEALPLVKKSLEDPKAEIRGAAISALVAIEPNREGLTEVLVKMLADDDQAVRHPAIAGLGEAGEGAMAAAPKLFELLKEDADRAEALEALGRIRSRDVDLYLTALDNRDPRVRLFACEALGRLGSDAEKAIPQLEKAERDRYDFVRRRAADAIRRIRG